MENDERKMKKLSWADSTSSFSSAIKQYLSENQLYLILRNRVNQNKKGVVSL
jgi:hypothetical protein